MATEHARIKRKRNRKFLVCTECRRKKIKCDRRLPCRNCVKSGRKCEFKAPDGRVIQPPETRAEEDAIFDTTPYTIKMPSQSSSVTTTATPTTNSSDSSSTARTSQSSSDLNLQIADLKQHLAAITRQVNGSTLPNSILDIKVPSMKRKIISAKPSRTLFVGHTSRYALLVSKPLFGYLVSTFKENINAERRAWKKAHQFHESWSVQILADPSGEEALLKVIKSILCPNFYAIQERLEYFKTSLNHLLYADMVPIEEIQALFVQRFPIRRADGSSYFMQPPKLHFYSELSAVCAIVYLVTVFTRYNTEEGKFKCPLAVPGSEIASLAVNLLNLSEFRRKKSHLALITLVVLRSALFVHDDFEGSDEDVNSYPVFQMCLDMCYQLGIHSNQESDDMFIFKRKAELKARSMSPPQVRRMWNFMQFTDVYYSLCLGTPLLVNYDYCVGFLAKRNPFELKLKEALELMRDVCQIINTLRPISVRQVLALVEKVTAFLHSLPFELIAAENRSVFTLEELANLFRLKLDLLCLLQCLNRMTILGVGNLYERSDVKEDKRNRAVLEKVAENMNMSMVAGAACSLFYIKAICDGKTIFGSEPDGKYIVFFRNSFSQSMDQSFLAWFTCLLSRATNNAEFITEVKNSTLLQNFPRNDLPMWEGDPIDPEALERVLFYRHTEATEEEGERLLTSLLMSAQLRDFGMKFYTVVCKHKVLKESLDSFLLLKGVIMFLYVLDTVEEYKAEAGVGSVDLGALCGKMKEKMKTDMDVSELDPTVRIETEEEQLQKMFDSIYTDQNWLNLPNAFEIEKGADLVGEYGPSGGFGNLPLDGGFAAPFTPSLSTTPDTGATHMSSDGSSEKYSDYHEDPTCM